MESELLEECLPQGPSALYVHDHINLKFSPFSHNPPLQNTGKSCKIFFSRLLLYTFFLRGCGKCFGLTSNIRKITPKCSFSINFQKILLDKNYGGNAPAPK